MEGTLTNEAPISPVPNACKALYNEIQRTASLAEELERVFSSVLISLVEVDKPNPEGNNPQCEVAELLYNHCRTLRTQNEIIEKIMSRCEL